MKYLLLLSAIVVFQNTQAHAFDSLEYAQSGEELCNFIDNYVGGLNEASMTCAMGSGEGRFSPDEATFCNRLILKKSLTPADCLDGIWGETTKDQLNKCEKLVNAKDILNCLKNP